jgi:two-component system invasion response regulator UvrY
MEKVSVVIADDHKMIAQAWATIVGLHPKLSVAGIFENTQDLLDMNINPISGLDAIPLIRKLSPGSRIIGVSMHNQTAYAKRMIRNGARGYVTKSSEKDEMYKAIETVMQGEVYLCNEIRDLLTHQALEEDKNPLSLLTEREIEVISLLKEGLSTNEIAERLFLSPRTVETHRARILKKLSLKNTVSLITYIQDHLSDLL